MPATAVSDKDLPASDADMARSEADRERGSIDGLAGRHPTTSSGQVPQGAAGKGVEPLRRLFPASVTRTAPFHDHHTP